MSTPRAKPRGSVFKVRPRSPRVFRRLRTKAGIATRHAWESFPQSPIGNLLVDARPKRVDKPVFFLGTQGGGLTLMARILRRHQQVVYCSGNSRFWAGRDEMQNVGHHLLPPSLRLVSEVGDQPEATPELGPIGRFLYASDWMFDRYRVDAAAVTPHDVTLLRKAVLRYVSTYGAAISTPRFVDKSQTYSLKIPLIQAAFPDAKFVLVTRNPYNLVASGTILGHLEKGAHQHNLELARKDLLRLLGEHWRNSIDTPLGDLEKSPHMVIRFEDFVDAPEKTLAQLVDFVELVNPGNLIPSPEHRIPFGSIATGKWGLVSRTRSAHSLDNLSSSDVELIQYVVGATAKGLGYEFP